MIAKNNTETLQSVSIVTGFLGAGKTSLINQLIREQGKNKQRKLAFIINEFGDINIDASLIVDARDNVLELSNGCLCCVMRGDLVGILNELSEHEQTFDHLIIETTGIANPAPLAETFYFDPQINGHYKLTSTVCVLDAVNAPMQWQNNPEWQQQLIFSDRVLISKSELAEAAEPQFLRDLIRQFNPDAAIEILPAAGTRRFCLDENQQRPQDLQALLKKWHEAKPENKHSRFQSISFVLPQKFLEHEIRATLGELIFGLQGKILRMKGILRLKNRPESFIIHSVNRLFECHYGEVWQDEEAMGSLVIIGENLDENAIRVAIGKCQGLEI